LFSETSAAAVYCGTIKPRVETAVAHQKCRHFFVVRHGVTAEEKIQASLGNRSQLGRGDGEIIEDEREHFAVEISAAYDFAVRKTRGYR